MANQYLEELRGVFDGNEPFMSGGLGIKKRRRSERERVCPTWMYDNKSVKNFLNQRFPRHRLSKYGLPLPPNRKQERLRLIWATVIVRYFRMSHASSWIAEDLCKSNQPVNSPGLPLFRRSNTDLSCTKAYVDRVVQQIRFLSHGLRTDGKRPTGRKRGRPKKTS
jgi:hypothetical protein